MNNQKTKFDDGFAWALTLVVTLMIFGVIMSCPPTTPATADIDAQIKRLRHQTDSARTNVDAAIQDSLRRNPYYWYQPTFNYTANDKNRAFRHTVRRNVRNYYYNELARQSRENRRQIDSLMACRRELLKHNRQR
ncbi:MAG: hypothetical protein Q4E56_02230 [Pseudomonadota bacterium]|nr:hypothetical protein [Pseudomonadota bacterium]